MKALYPIIDDHKECNRCHVTKQVSEFGRWKNASGVFVPTSDCKKCRAEYAMNRNRSLGTKPRTQYPIIDGHKECGDCHTIKPVSEYWKGTNGSGTITYNKLCKICTKKNLVAKARVKGVPPRRERVVIDGHSECNTCHVVKPLSDYVIRKKKDGSLSPIAHCKECTNKKQVERARLRGIQPKKHYPVIDGMKLCGKCNVTKPISEYSNNRHHCKDCMRVYFINTRRSKGVQPKKFYPIIDGHKQCIRCDEVKPIDQYRKTHRLKSGIIGHCIECDLNEGLKYRRAKGMVPKTFVAHPIIDGLKQCYVCNETLSVDQFSLNSRGQMIHSCKACSRKKELPYRHKYRKRDCEEITDGYIAGMLRKDTKLKKKDIPQELFEIYRKKVIMKRELKQLKQSI